MEIEIKKNLSDEDFVQILEKHILASTIYYTKSDSNNQHLKVLVTLTPLYALSILKLVDKVLVEVVTWRISLRVK